MAEFEHLGPYKLGDLIGRGGMGSVYAATHGKTGEEVAVKLIAQHVADDERFRRRFAGEVETLKRLRHPNIVRLIGYGEEDGRLFYSMEWVRGQSLQQRIRETKRMGWLPSVEIAIETCAALKHAHDFGVIHRDLKPANLLITDSGQVKLVDFGIAKLFGFGEQTLAGSVLGTADYMAPEQAGTDPITPRTDLYALGSVMYAMLAGRAPFSGKKLTEVIECLKRDRPVPLELINPDVPEEIVHLVHQLLEKDPADRPPTALSVGKRLKAIRFGLQREKTVNVDSVATQVAPTDQTATKPVDADTQRTLPTEASALTPHDALTNPTGPKRPTRIRVERGGTSQESHLEDANDLELTVASHVDVVPFKPAPVSATQSRFETIDESSREGYWWHRQGDHADSGNPMQIFSVAAMIAILLGGAWLFYQAVATPSADQLFATLQQAQADDALTLAEPTLRRFLAAYPDDERIDQVTQWQREAERDRTLRRLMADARAAGGVSQLPPARAAFMEAMNLRESNGQAARTQLQWWLDVFAPDAEQPSESADHADLKNRLNRNLAMIAREEITRLAKNPPDPTSDPRLTDLMQRIGVAKELPEDSADRLLRGLIKLYDGKPWAAPAITAAQERLNVQR